MDGVLMPGIIMLALTPDWLTDRVGEALVGQAVIGLIALVSFFSILRRFLSTEFPSAMAAVNGRLDTLHEDFETFQREFRANVTDLAVFKDRVANLWSRVERLESRDLEGTGSFRRPPGGGTPRRDR